MHLSYFFALVAKKVLIDDEIFYRQPFGGVSKIFATLISALNKQNHFKLHFYNFYTENEYLLKLKLSTVKPYLKGYSFPLKGKIVRLICKFISHKKINNILRLNQKLVFHPTFYNNYYLKTLQKSNNVKLVFTVHDLIHEKFGSTNHYKQIAQYKKENLKIADAIITVSENTKKDILELYPFVEPSKIMVNYLAQSLTQENALPIDNLPENYILFVGERSGYKNFEALVKSFSLISAKYPNLKVFCTGSKPFSVQEKKQFNTLHLSARFIQQKLSLPQLKTAYLNAIAFVFPSLYEGFGIPILEAFACKTPTIISNCGSLPEVAGNAALLFEPNNAAQLAQKIEELLINNNLREELILKGLAREKQFTWQNHIENTFKIYESVK